MPPFALIAHRGAPLRAPENSLAGFRLAWEAGCREIECDVQLTTDGVPVLCHDHRLRRYRLGRRLVEQCSLAELSKLDFGKWFSPAFRGAPIARLEDLFATYGAAVSYHVEIKGAHPILPLAILALAERFRLIPHCVFISFQLGQLRRARAAHPTARLGWIVRAIKARPLASAARELDLYQVLPRARHLHARAARLALACVEQIRPWDCPRHPRRARRLAQRLATLGCSGLTIDEPLWFAEELRPA